MRAIDITPIVSAHRSIRRARVAVFISWYLLLMVTGELSGMSELREDSPDWMALWFTAWFVASSVVFFWISRGMKKGDIRAARVFLFCVGTATLSILTLMVWWTGSTRPLSPFMFVLASPLLIVAGHRSLTSTQAYRSALDEYPEVEWTAAGHVSTKYVRPRLRIIYRVAVVGIFGAQFAAFLFLNIGKGVDRISARASAEAYRTLDEIKMPMTSAERRSARELVAWGLLIIGVSGPVGMILVLRHIYRAFVRRSTMQADELRSNDARRPILLLRSFSDDGTYITATRRYLYFRWKVITLEQVIANHLMALGPVIAIGNPKRRVRVAGAGREFVVDDDWTVTVQERIGEAGIVVAILGASAGLRREYELLEERGDVLQWIAVMPPGTQRQLMQRWTALRAHLDLPALDVAVDTTSRKRKLLAVACRRGKITTVVTGQYRDQQSYELALTEALDGLV